MVRVRVSSTTPLQRLEVGRGPIRLPRAKRLFVRGFGEMFGNLFRLRELDWVQGLRVGFGNWFGFGKTNSVVVLRCSHALPVGSGVTRVRGSYPDPVVGVRLWQNIPMFSCTTVEPGVTRVHGLYPDPVEGLRLWQNIPSCTNCWFR